MSKIFYAIPAFVLITGCGTSDKSGLTKSNPVELTYPESRKDTTVKDDYFGIAVTDPYRWLENDTSAETAAWVKAQNAVTENYLEKIPFRDAIRKRYQAMFNFEKYSSPFREGKYTYYYKNSGLQNQSVLYREAGDGSVAEIFLDPNTFSKDGTTSLAGIHFTKDGTFAAYNISEGGSDWQKLVVLDAITKKQTGDTLDIKFGEASWKGNDGFYYSTYDKPKDRSLLSGVTEKHKLYYHKLGTAQKEDRIIFGDGASTFRYISAYVSENQKWLIIYAANETYGNALYIQDLTRAGSKIMPVVSDMKNTNDVIVVDDSYFYIHTDRDAPTGKIVLAPLSDPSPSNWKTIVNAKPEVLSASSAGGYIYCSYLKDALSRVYQFDKTGKQIREIKLPGLGSAEGFAAKDEEKDLYFTFASFTTPPSIYKLNIASGNAELYKQPKLQFDVSNYESKQVFYSSKDGTKIPMILTYKKGIKLNGKNPCLLHGYGGFSVSVTPWFSTSKIVLIENGGIFAVANLRGGGEYGEEWHQQGIKTKKQNVFDDFIAAAKFLVDSSYTSRDFLAIEGGSNGGLLVGACMTQHPEMFRVALPEVGVMDMLRYHKFTAGAGWAYDYGTSGDSKEMFEYLYKYSPLHNLKKSTSYPATLIFTADHDDRVVPAHSFKFAATMQEVQKGANPVLIRIETKAGHGAGMSTDQIIEQQTDLWSFMFYNMGVKPGY